METNVRNVNSNNKGRKGKKNLLSFLLSMLKVGVIGFGGGSALIPVVETELVEDKKLLSESEYTKDTIIANITPGALPVKLAALAGYSLHGTTGSILGAYTMAFPGVFLTILLLSLFSLLGENTLNYIEYASVGISAFIVFLLFSYIRKVLISEKGLFWPYFLIMLVSFALTGWSRIKGFLSSIFHITSFPFELPVISAIELIGITIGIIFIVSLFGKKQERISYERTFTMKHIITLLVFLLVPAIIAVGVGIFMPAVNVNGFSINAAASTVSSFGGGEAYVTLADEFFVKSGYVDGSVLYNQILSVCNALPGPILVKVATGIGLMYGGQFGGIFAGIILALCAYLITVGVCSGVAILVLGGYETISNSPFIQNLKRFVLPVICGLLITTCISMFTENMKICAKSGLPGAIAFTGIMMNILTIYALHKRYHWNDTILLVTASVLSLGALMLIHY